MLFAATNMLKEKMLVSLVLLLFPFSVWMGVDARCMPSPSVTELFASEDYVIRGKIERKYNNTEGSVCNSRQAQPVLATVLEVFKGTNAPAGVYPAVGDEVLVNYMTDTGYMQFGFYINEDLEWDPEGYMLFPVLQTGCVGTGDIDYPVFSINSCHYEGTKAWSSLEEEVKTLLRSTEEWRNEKEEEEAMTSDTMRMNGAPATADDVAATITATSGMAGTNKVDGDGDDNMMSSSSFSSMMITRGVLTILFLISCFGA